MKKIIITGKNGYIGNKFKTFLSKYSDKYEVTMISVRDESWKALDFSSYDIILHAAGIAHADTGTITEEKKKEYYKINTQLTLDIAKKFKIDRQNKYSQFIYMSSIIVYGTEATLSKKNIITKETKPKPVNCYGDSKLQADTSLEKMKDANFLVSIIRPPMVYGPGCKGNFKTLEKLVDILPVFPDVNNQRSMIHIDKLCKDILKIINQELQGIIFVQDNEYHKTSDLVRQIAEQKNEKIFITGMFNWFIVLLSRFPGKIGDLTNKAFGNLVYSKNECVK